MIENVIFDLGGVLIDWDPRYLYRKLLPSEEEVEWFLTHVCTPQWNSRQDGGRAFSEAVAALSRDFPEYEELIRAFQQRWPETLGGAIQESVDILQDLKRRKVPVFALSNWSAETFPEARRRFAFLSEFDGIVISGQVGTVKPDPLIFTVLLERYQLEPSRSLFIDDALPNVEAARRLGLLTHHFKGPGRLRKLLKRRGLLPGSSPRSSADHGPILNH